MQGFSAITVIGYREKVTCICSFFLTEGSIWKHGGRSQYHVTVYLTTDHSLRNADLMENILEVLSHIE